MKRGQNNGTARTAKVPIPAETAAVPVPAFQDRTAAQEMTAARASVPEETGEIPSIPSGELEGMEEFGSLRNWVSFDAPRGKLVCRSQEAEYEEFQAIILESRAVRTMKDEDGNVLCASSDRVTADTGRIGLECATCEDRDVHCFPRWWIAWADTESGLLFAHTLSRTGTFNFQRYVTRLLREKLTPGQVLTRIFVEEARRQKTGTLYRRIQFERMGGEAPVERETSP